MPGNEPSLPFIQSDDQSYASQEYAVVLFESPWCGGCHDVLRYLEKIAIREEFKSWFFGKVDITQNQGLAQQYGVMSLPTIILFHQGTPVERLTSSIPEKLFTQTISKYIHHAS